MTPRIDPLGQCLERVTCPAELPAISGGWTRQSFDIGGQELLLELPAVPDALLDEPETLAANLRDDYMPYWGYLWPAAKAMAGAILAENWSATLPAMEPVLELGSGVGLVGLAARAAGLRTIFTDYERRSVQLSLWNARLNGWQDTAGYVLDWRDPPAAQFRLILGCEVIYELQNHALVLNVLDRMLAPGGMAWIGDPQRHQSDKFVSLAREQGYELSRHDLPPFASGQTLHPVQVWRLRRRQDT